MLTILQSFLMWLYHASMLLCRGDQIFFPFVLVNSLIPVIFMAQCHMVIKLITGQSRLITVCRAETTVPVRSLSSSLCDTGADTGIIASILPGLSYSKPMQKKILVSKILFNILESQRPWRRQMT